MKKTLIVAVTVLGFAMPAHALVKPSLQPIHLYKRYKAVLAGEVVSAELADDDMDVESGRITLKVTAVCRGEFKSKDIMIDVPAWDDCGESAYDSGEDWNIWDVAVEKRTFVAFVGKQGRRGRGEDEILLYCGDRQWRHARIADMDKPSDWTYQCASEQVMVGTFNGDSTRLAEMSADTKAGTAFFPAIPTVRLNRYVTIGTLPAAARGVTLFDLDSDGDLDVLACCEIGIRVYLQGNAPKFTDATKDLGLAGVSGKSCALADVNGDGRSDLLVDNHLFLQKEQRFAKTALPEVAIDARLKVSSFVQLNGDGHADILLSHAGGGLNALLNDGKARDVSIDGNEIGLCAARQLATLVEDLNMDGYADLYTISRDENQPNQFHTNRGYGSFMQPSLYDSACFGKAHEKGAWGVAAGDVNGDGMNDLLHGHVDGNITLVLSDAAEARQPTEHPTYHAKKLQQTRIVSVTLKGHGVVGADVRLVDDKGKTALRRNVGTQVLTGCRCPDTVNLAIREPGDYTLRVRFAAGTVKEEQIRVGETKHVSLTVRGG